MPKGSKPTSQGKCSLCRQIFPKAGITRHLASCRKAAGEKMSGAREQNVFHIVIEAKYIPHYWLHVDMPGKARLRDLDEFLRNTWLECCGHLSMFTIAGRRYSIDTEDFFSSFDEGEEEVSMDIAIDKVLTPKIKIDYEYDFGSTTELTLRVISEQKIKFSGKEIRLLARNEEPLIMCEKCGETKATKVCGQCVYDDGAWLCGKCAKKHRCGEDMLLPVVNSPRTGICAYCG